MLRSMTVIVVALLVLPMLTAAPGPAATAGSAELVVLDRHGWPVTAITDGDLIRLRLRLPEPTRSPLAIAFRLAGLPTAVAGCTVAVGRAGCDTAPFHSLGWHWDPGGVARPQRVVMAWAGGAPLAQSRQLQVAPRPVVLVHGFNSNWQTWTTYLGPDGYLAAVGLAGFAVGDGQVPGVMNTGQVTNPTVRTNTIAQNAQILSDYIEAVKDQTGAQQVDLVAHSMGGLISRYYIDRLMGERGVGQFITLGTPNAGTDCANLPGALGMLHPATLEIRPAYVNHIFNQQITRLHGVPYHAVAGTSVENAVGAPCTRTPTDLLVSLDSAGALPVEVLEVDFLHHELNKDQTVFDTVVRPLLQTSPGSFNAEPDPVLPLAPAEPLQFTRIYTGHVAAGGSDSFTIQIEPGIAVASFALFDPTRSLTVTVRGASGSVINLDPQTNGLVVVDDPDTLVFLGYGFNNPNPGPWQVTLSTTAATPAAGADYAVTAYLQGGAALQAQVTPLLPSLNDSVQLAGSLQLAGQTVPIDSAQAVIHTPDGGTTVVTLSVVGGVLQDTVQPQAAGLHGIDVLAIGRLPDGTVIERSAYLAFEAQPAPNLVPTFIFLGCVLLLLLGILAVGALLAIRVVRRVTRRA